MRELKKKTQKNGALNGQAKATDAKRRRRSAAPTPPAAVNVDAAANGDGGTVCRREACIRRRLASTVRLRPLPARLRLADLYSLCPEAQAARLPWNRARHRHKGVAFLEFATPQAAVRQAAALSGSKALGRELATSICPDAAAADAGAYSDRRVVVSSLSPRTTEQQLAALAGAGAVVKFADSGQQLRADAPRVAVVTFADAKAALAAVRTLQGAELHGRKTSWMFEKLSSAPKPEASVDRSVILVSGVAKHVTREQLQSALPGCSHLQLDGAGSAVARYADEQRCAEDFGDGWATVGGARLRLAFGHRRVSERRLHLAPAASVASSLLVAGLPPGVGRQQLRDFAPGLRGVEFLANRRLAALVFADRQLALAAKRQFRAKRLMGSRVLAAFTVAGLRRLRLKRPRDGDAGKASD